VLDNPSDEIKRVYYETLLLQHLPYLGLTSGSKPLKGISAKLVDNKKKKKKNKNKNRKQKIKKKEKTKEKKSERKEKGVEAGKWKEV
jgi:hypothetical protein